MEQGVVSQSADEPKPRLINFCPGLKEGVNEALRQQFAEAQITICYELPNKETLPAIMTGGWVWRGLLEIQNYIRRVPGSGHSMRDATAA